MTFQQQFEAASALFSREEMEANLSGHVSSAIRSIKAEWSARNKNAGHAKWARKYIREQIATLRSASEMKTWLAAA